MRKLFVQGHSWVNDQLGTELKTLDIHSVSLLLPQDSIQGELRESNLHGLQWKPKAHTPTSSAGFPDCTVQLVCLLSSFPSFRCNSQSYVSPSSSICHRGLKRPGLTQVFGKHGIPGNYYAIVLCQQGDHLPVPLQVP
jgi:hypothetical protein